jgi:DNA-binding transcriptional ArsR family regulator
MQTLEAAQELRIDTIELRKATMVLRSINHPLRQQMLKIIHQVGAMTVTELYVKLRLEQSVASQHLAILRSAALVVTERKAKNIFYSVNTGRLDSVHSIVSDLIKSPLALPQPA